MISVGVSIQLIFESIVQHYIFILSKKNILFLYWTILSYIILYF